MPIYSVEPALVLEGVGDKIAYGPDSTLAIGGNNNVTLWKQGILEGELDTRGTKVEAIAYSPYSGILAVGLASGSVAIFNPDRKKIVEKFIADNISSLAFGPNDILAVGSTVWWGEQGLRVFDLRTGLTSFGFANIEGSVSSVAYSPDGYLAAAEGDIVGNVVVFPPGIKEGRKLDPDSGLIKSVAYGPQTLAAGTREGVLIWGLGGELIRKIDVGRVLSVAYDKQGNLAVGLEQGTIMIWEPGEVEPTQILNTRTFQPVMSLAYDPNTGSLAAGLANYTVLVWRRVDTISPVKRAALSCWS